MAKEKKLIRFDWAIKNLFKKNRDLDVLQGFLADLLQKDITSIKLCDTDGIKDGADDKSNRVDVHVTIQSGEEIIIEVQAYSEWDYFSRILYGTSKAITNHMKEGYSYRKVPKIISISICYFEIGEGVDYLYKGFTNFIGLNYGDTLGLNANERKMYIENAEEISQIYPEYYIIKVNKFKEIVKNQIDEWVYFFKTEEIKKDFHSKGLKKAAKHLNYLKLQNDERKDYEIFIENLRLEKSLARSQEIDLEVAKEEGLQEGIEKGKKEEKLKIAKKMLRSNRPVDEIVDLTDLSTEEVESLRKGK
jgi:predicted transposase/invertase (TIGR01784 family)